jgi:hypothetical protein
MAGQAARDVLSDSRPVGDAPLIGKSEPSSINISTAGAGLATADLAQTTSSEPFIDLPTSQAEDAPATAVLSAASGLETISAPLSREVSAGSDTESSQARKDELVAAKALARKSFAFKSVSVTKQFLSKTASAAQTIKTVEKRMSAQMTTLIIGSNAPQHQLAAMACRRPPPLDRDLSRRRRAWPLMPRQVAPIS